MNDAGPKIKAGNADFNAGLMITLSQHCSVHVCRRLYCGAMAMSQYGCLTIKLDDCHDKVSYCRDICAALCVFSFYCGLSQHF